ncbi:unnamed protein product [marine sediment metagenome]|uniref:Uncharacterized protein n=1 Tax=marine sediment metagenome TaxID=412755 RepID=X1CUX3_9ZZZZ
MRLPEDPPDEDVKECIKAENELRHKQAMADFRPVAERVYL